MAIEQVDRQTKALDALKGALPSIKRWVAYTAVGSLDDRDRSIKVQELLMQMREVIEGN